MLKVSKVTRHKALLISSHPKWQHCCTCPGYLGEVYSLHLCKRALNEGPVTEKIRLACIIWPSFFPESRSSKKKVYNIETWRMTLRQRSIRGRGSAEILFRLVNKLSRFVAKHFLLYFIKRTICEKY